MINHEVTLTKVRLLTSELSDLQLRLIMPRRIGMNLSK